MSTPDSRLDGSADGSTQGSTQQTTRAWGSTDLQRAGAAEELQLASQRPDGTLRPYVTMWVVRADVGDDSGLYVRSAYGADNPWYRRARAAGRGRIRAGGAQADVAFVVVPVEAREVHTAADEAFHTKYDRYGARIVGSVTGEQARQVTLRLVPLDQ